MNYYNKIQKNNQFVIKYCSDNKKFETTYIIN